MLGWSMGASADWLSGLVGTDLQAWTFCLRAEALQPHGRLFFVPLLFVCVLGPFLGLTFVLEHTLSV